jgi:hypothetical protein
MNLSKKSVILLDTPNMRTREIWFAWWPVQTLTGYKWLTHVYRQLINEDECIARWVYEDITK